MHVPLVQYNEGSNLLNALKSNDIKIVKSKVKFSFSFSILLYIVNIKFLGSNVVYIIARIVYFAKKKIVFRLKSL